MVDERPCIWVLAGTNGAGKSSVGGALLRQSGGEYFNPDLAAERIRNHDPSLDQTQANSLAWSLGVRQLDAAILGKHDYFFETTLGGATVTARLLRALDAGYAVRIWYAGLGSPELHIARVAARVRSGGHDIPEETIRRRYDGSRRNLILLVPRLTELRVFDNSADADPKRGKQPEPRLVVHVRDGKILGPKSFRSTPEWAKPIVAQVLKQRR